MVEATDRLYEALDRAKTRQSLTIREIISMARYLARQEVRQNWKAQGRRAWDYSQKELSEKADEYLRLRPELIGEAITMLDRAKLETSAQQRKR
jgi:hypothetical protein